MTQIAPINTWARCSRLLQGFIREIRVIGAYPRFRHSFLSLENVTEGEIADVGWT